MLDDGIVRKAFAVLQRAKKDFVEFEEITGRSIPLRDFEPRYGEWFVAQTLLDHGFHIDRIGQRGPDIVTTDGARIEVKTSRRTNRFRQGGKPGYGWVVPRRQWEDHEFDFLACVLADKSPPQALYFDYDEVVTGFTLANWNWIERVIRARKLDLMDDLEAFEANTRVARERYGFEGEPTEFERGLSEHPQKYFEMYTFDRMAQRIRAQETRA